MKNYWAIIKRALRIDNSSLISDVEYKEASGLLTVTFINGRTYNYFKVPKDVYDGLMSAGSMGVYFNTTIRGTYKYREI